MKKTYKIMLIAMAIVCLIIPSVYASSFQFTCKADKTTLEAGEQVTLELGVASIDAGDLGISTVEGTLEYDKDIFETVTSSSFTSLNNWSISYNEQTGKFLAAIISEGVKQDQSIGKLTLKLKSGISDKTTNVKITGITSNDGTTTMNDTDKTIAVVVNKVAQPNPDPDPDTNTTNTANTTNTTNTANPSKNVTNIAVGNTKNTTVGGNLPKAGLSDFAIVGIIVTLVVAIGSYIKYKAL